MRDPTQHLQFCELLRVCQFNSLCRSTWPRPFLESILGVAQRKVGRITTCQCQICLGTTPNIPCAMDCHRLLEMSCHESGQETHNVGRGFGHRCWPGWLPGSATRQPGLQRASKPMNFQAPGSYSSFARREASEGPPVQNGFQWI